MTVCARKGKRRRRTEPQLAKSDHLDLDLSKLWLNFIEGIMSALHQIQEKAHKDGLKKNEETISRAKTIDDPAEKFEFLCENCLKTETAKFQGLYEKFCKDQANHLQALKGIISNYKEEKERLCTRYEQLTLLIKFAKLEESLKKKKQDYRTFSVLRKTLGSFLESDEDIPADD
ncbi:hypothetical protein ACE6H2_000802 [Prunus campanulata]